MFKPKLPLPESLVKLNLPPSFNEALESLSNFINFLLHPLVIFIIVVLVALLYATIVLNGWELWKYLRKQNSKK